MSILKELVAILCVLLLVWMAVSPIGAPNVLLVLPVVGMLCAACASQRLSPTMEFDPHLPESSCSSVSGRAPPQL